MQARLLALTSAYILLGNFIICDINGFKCYKHYCMHG